jgi:3-hydroxyisobutyrate dehydrogenase-like beta-hydroxyacid dehydrogenase
VTSPVGIIGLGAMGAAMSANLVAAGFDVTGFDIDAARVQQLVERGGRGAASPGAVSRIVDVLILSLPSAAAFDAVAVEPEGIAAGAHDGLVVIETSTLPIDVKERGRAALAQHGVTLLDCPLSGTGDQAVHRDVVVLASGNRAAVERCAPVFDGFARAHHYIGEFGAGSKMKFIANLLVAIHNVAAAEALSLATAAGLDPRQTFDVISDGAGTSRMFEVRVPKMIEGAYGSGVRTSVFQKDLAAIDDFAVAHRASVPLMAVAKQLYVAAAAAGHADDDTAAVYEVYELLRSGDRADAKAPPAGARGA